VDNQTRRTHHQIKHVKRKSITDRTWWA